MIFITGATGQLGSAVVSHLLKKGLHPSEISVLVRDAGKAEALQAQGVTLKLGDYTDPASLVQAFQGAEKLLLISSNDRAAIENRTAHHQNVIAAAQAAGVAHVVYTSFVRKPGHEASAIAAFQNSHRVSEASLAASGMPYTILQNGIYAEMIPAFVGQQLAETGTLVFPAGAGKANWTLRSELAEAAAHVLLTADHAHQTYTLAQPEALGFAGIAQALSHALGKEISYHSPDPEAFQALLQQGGVPEALMGMLTQWGTAIAQNTLDTADGTLAAFLGRRPTTGSEFITKTWGG